MEIHYDEGCPMKVLPRASAQAIARERIMDAMKYWGC
jgi:hypothetical protein